MQEGCGNISPFPLLLYSLRGLSRDEILGEVVDCGEGEEAERYDCLIAAGLRLSVSRHLVSFSDHFTGIIAE